MDKVQQIITCIEKQLCIPHFLQWIEILMFFYIILYYIISYIIQTSFFLTMDRLSLSLSLGVKNQLSLSLSLSLSLNLIVSVLQSFVSFCVLHIQFSLRSAHDLTTSPRGLRKIWSMKLRVGCVWHLEGCFLHKHRFVL